MKIKEIIFKHNENDFELWKDFTLTEEEEIIIQNIFMWFYYVFYVAFQLFTLLILDFL